VRIPPISLSSPNRACRAEFQIDEITSGYSEVSPPSSDRLTKHSKTLAIPPSTVFELFGVAKPLTSTDRSKSVLLGSRIGSDGLETDIRTTIDNTDRRQNILCSNRMLSAFNWLTRTDRSSSIVRVFYIFVYFTHGIYVHLVQSR